MKSLTVLAILMILAPARLMATSAMSPTVIKNVRQSCVEILVERQLRGGGAIVKTGEKGTFVITAAHLFPLPNVHITVMTEAHGKFNANLIAYDFGHDLALLQLTTKSTLPGLDIAGYTPSATQPVYNFGPALRRRTLIISGNMADSRVNYTDFEPSDGYLAHIFIAAINPVLTSGGIWVNQKGDIVGVQSGRLKGDAGAPSSGLSMACPPSAIRQLIKNRTPASTPGIGAWVWELWTLDSDQLRRIPGTMDGLAVRWVRENGPMDRAGIKAHDVILTCNGKSLTRRNEFFSQIRSKPVGTTFTITVFSPATRKVRNVKLTTMPLENRWNLYLQKLRSG